MILVSFHIHCAEGTRGTQILARSATYAALDINRRDLARAAVARLQRHHSDGTRWAMTGAVVAILVVTQHDTILTDPYGMSYLYG